MKKTFNINLGGIVFHIDEDAYELLDKYLSNLRIHFSKEEGAEEIVHDMELRISELFSERLDDKKQVITLTDVEEIIAQMGKPEEFADDTTQDSNEYTDEKKGTYPEAVEMIRNLRLNIENSVIIRNDRFGTGDKAFIESMVNELVDNILTLNQLQLIASSPIFFNVTADNVMTAKNVFLAIADRRPVMFTNSDGEKVVPQLEVANVKIDPGLLELFDRWESILLSYLGINCVPITKRAQQTVSEVQSNNDEIRLILDGKFFYRDQARKRIEDMFGGRVGMINMINEWRDEEMRQEQDDQEVVPYE